MRDVGLQAGFDRGMRPGATRPYPHATALVRYCRRLEVGTLGRKHARGSPLAPGPGPLAKFMIKALLGNLARGSPPGPRTGPPWNGPLEAWNGPLEAWNGGLEA